MNREERKVVFEDTMEIVRGLYSTDVEKSIAAGKGYTSIVESNKDVKGCTDIYVTNSTSFNEASKWVGDTVRVGVLNFASGTNPGGGVTKGSSAQEECLCRESTLYSVISDKKFREEFYGYHRNLGSALYSDRVIYTPDIVVLKDNNGKLLGSEFIIDVFTCCAPNLRKEASNKMNPNAGKEVKLTDKGLLDVLIRRYTNLLNIVAESNIDVFITVAIGCGAFQNKPFIVASAWKKALGQSNFNGTCVFAVYCKKGEEYNYDIFKRLLGKRSKSR